jgi:hypothetical protein
MVHQGMMLCLSNHTKPKKGQRKKKHRFYHVQGAIFLLYQTIFSHKDWSQDTTLIIGGVTDYNKDRK